MSRQLYNSLRKTFSTFDILTPGGRVVKSKTGRIYQELPKQTKEVMIKTIIDYNIVFN